MFGYILPNRSMLYLKDFELYRSFYCGICKSMGENFGQKTRFLINYDITFFAIVIFNYFGTDVNLVKLKCVTKPFTDRKMVEKAPLLKIVSALNIMLSYYKVEDDIFDGKKKRKYAKSMLNRPLKKAMEILPNCSEIMAKSYAQLRDLEKNQEESVDRVSHEFAEMMTDCVKEVGKAYGKTLGKEIILDDNFLLLCYNVSKWIYIADAISDVEEDVKCQTYNPFLANYNFETMEKFKKDKWDEVEFAINSTLKKIQLDLSVTPFCFNQDLVDNIVQKGMSIVTAEILKGNQWKETMKF